MAQVEIAVTFIIFLLLFTAFVFQPLREISEETASDTISSFLSQNIKGSRLIAIISALITIIFLGSYAAAQLVAGSFVFSFLFK